MSAQAEQEGVSLYKASLDELDAALSNDFVDFYLRKSLERGRGKETIGNIHADLRQAKAQLWILADKRDIVGIAMTEIITYPRKKVCRVIAAVGEERHRWQHHLAGVEDWARQIGCEGMELMARPGWARVFKDYTETHRQLEKDL